MVLYDGEDTPIEIAASRGYSYTTFHNDLYFGGYDAVHGYEVFRLSNDSTVPVPDTYQPDRQLKPLGVY